MMQQYITLCLERSDSELRSDVPVRRSAKTKPVVGGSPITYEQAVELRKVVYGSSVHSFSTGWKQAAFHFKALDSSMPWGLCTERNGSRGVLMCVQAYLIKHLVFKYDKREDIFSHNVLEPSEWDRKNALIQGMCEVLWKVGEEQKCSICLADDAACFPKTQLQQYKYDGITERLHLFEFRSRDALEIFIKRNFCHFEAEGGCILFLYSLVLSRTLAKICREHGDPLPQLLSDNEEVTQPLINLFLTGRAVKHAHNGNIVYDLDGKALSKPMVGISERSDIGYLNWHREAESRNKEVGSMLKTPKRPIWVTQINGPNIGVLFSTNPDLVSDWRVEHRFTLHYYTGLPTQTRVARLCIDTRYGNKVGSWVARSRFSTDREKKLPSVDHCIQTKWPGADVDWNSLLPFV